MRLLVSLLLGFVLALSSCSVRADSSTLLATPVAAVPIFNATGELIASQPGPQWVLLSSVDEHGVVAEPQVSLFVSTDAGEESSAQILTGTAARVVQILHTGPQNLQRYYLVETVAGEIGWVSDFYVRSKAYLFNFDGTMVPLFSSPGGQVTIQVPNVSPVILLDPISNPNWWEVGLLNDNLTGWVEVDYVKESSEEEFLLNVGTHQDDDHSQ